ncbi:MAG: helix-turn-helix transcriptional regulator [Anaerolineae bacterium]|nr:helix-turn-helix transcriptional regulator [Anaerolineae bacterium]
MDKQLFLHTLYRVMGKGTQTALAHRLGVNPSTITRILKGERKPGGRFLRSLFLEFPQVSAAEWGLLAENPPAHDNTPVSNGGEPHEPAR